MYFERFVRSLRRPLHETRYETHAGMRFHTYLMMHCHVIMKSHSHLHLASSFSFSSLSTYMTSDKVAVLSFIFHVISLEWSEHFMSGVM